MIFKDLTLSVTENPKGIFTAQIHEVRGAIVQETSKEQAIRTVFHQAYRCLQLNGANLID